MVGSIYNILSKVLISRLSGVMDKHISLKQHAFLKDILLVDEVVVLNELVDLVSVVSNPSSYLKLILRKHVALLVGFFLDYMLSRFEFKDKWRSWITICVFSGNLSFLVNNFPTQEICIQRGLK